MLRRDTVGFGDHLLLVVADDYLTVVLPGLAGRVCGGKYRQQPLDFFHCIARKLFGIGDQDRRRRGAMLGLTEKISGADFPVDTFISDNERLRGTGKQVYADAAEQLALGLR